MNLKNFNNYISESSPRKGYRGTVFMSFDGKHWFDENEMASEEDEIGDNYDEERFYDYDSFINSKFAKYSSHLSRSKLFNIYLAHYGRPLIVRERK